MQMRHPDRHQMVTRNWGRMQAFQACTSRSSPRCPLPSGHTASALGVHGLSLDLVPSSLRALALASARFESLAGTTPCFMTNPSDSSIFGAVR
eukprot:805253-Rhodomonas_salina.1